ncbi:hypothetical protein LTR67_008394 [Exophiala xenobiotica]|jgi:hypothetical protein
MVSQASPAITIVPISDSEKASEKLTDDTLFKIIQTVHRDGIVGLGNAVSIEHEDAINAQMCADVEYLRSRNALWHIQGVDTGNVSLAPPVNKGLFYRDVYANPWALQVLQYLLGPNSECCFLRSNVCLRGTQRQRVHSDMDFRFPELPFCYTLNTCLVETTVENGATEVWLGTHGNTSIEDHIASNEPFIKPELLEERRKTVPPIRACLPKGTMVIRDPRLWHAGIPNNTDETRVMLSQMFFAKWYGNRLRLQLPAECKEMVAQWEKDGSVKFQADYIETENFDHLQLDGLDAVTGPAKKDGYVSPNNFPFEGKIQPLISVNEVVVN